MKKSFVVFPALLIVTFLLSCGSGSEEKAANTPDVKKKASSASIPARTKTGETVTIAWDPPSEGSDSVDYYELFYQTSRDSGWTIIKREIKDTFASVYTLELDSEDSVYNFAVRSVLKSGMKSDFCFSTDSADATGKWPLVVHKK